MFFFKRNCCVTASVCFSIMLKSTYKLVVNKFGNTLNFITNTFCIFIYVFLFITLITQVDKKVCLHFDLKHRSTKNVVFEHEFSQNYGSKCKKTWKN